MPTALRDPRLSRAGNWLARHLTQALEALVRVENWLRTPNERELRAQDREILQPLLARVGDQASVVAELVLGPEPQTGENAMNEAMRHGDRATASERDVAACHRRGVGHLAWRGVPSAGACRRSVTGKPRPAPSAQRGSIIDSFEPILKELLAKYPNLTVERALQELQARGFTGGYTVVRRTRPARCGRAPRRPPCRALRPSRACKRKWTMASTTSTSHVKAAGASTCSATCSATRGGSICASSSRWTC